MIHFAIPQQYLIVNLQVPSGHTGSDLITPVEVNLQGLTFKVTGKVDDSGTLIITEIRSCNAEIIAIPVHYTDYDANSLLSTLTQSINAKLIKLSNG